MRIAIASVVGLSAAIFTVGCEVHERGPAAEVGIGASVDVDAGGPVIDDPGVVAFDVEPPPDQRVYVYDEGFPPGVYLYDNYYYYGGYRYPRDVFVNRYVHENISRGRYTNVTENRRQGQQIEQRHRAEFTKTGGHRTPANRAAANRTDVNRTERPGERTEKPEVKREERPAVNQPQRPPQDRPAVTHEEHPDVTHQPRTPEPREQRPANTHDERTVEPRKETPNGVHQPATPGEKEKAEEHREEQK